MCDIKRIVGMIKVCYKSMLLLADYEQMMSLVRDAGLVEIPRILRDGQRTVTRRLRR